MVKGIKKKKERAKPKRKPRPPSKPVPKPKRKRAIRRMQPNGRERQLPSTPLTQEQHKRRMLKELSRGVSPTYAAQMVGLARSTAYSWRGQHPEFKQAWDEAVAEGIDRLEDEAHRRAVHGVRKPVYLGGECVGYIQEYSDKLMELLLRGRRPLIYRNDAPTGPTTVKVKLTLEQARDRLKELGLQVPERPRATRK